MRHAFASPRRPMRRIPLCLLAAALAAGAVAAGAHSAKTPGFLDGKLAWRSIGPYIGGRVVAVAGVPRERNLFYMGAVDGGGWKSTDY